jgi:hypothetical protein
MQDWRQYVASGDNTLYGDSIRSSPSIGGGSIVSGHVRQNAFTANSAISTPVSANENTGLGWVL